jgi:hypothetical protein
LDFCTPSLFLLLAHFNCDHLERGALRQTFPPPFRSPLRQRTQPVWVASLTNSIQKWAGQCGAPSFAAQRRTENQTAGRSFRWEPQEWGPGMMLLPYPQKWYAVQPEARHTTPHAPCVFAVLLFGAVAAPFCLAISPGRPQRPPPPSPKLNASVEGGSAAVGARPFCSPRPVA